MQCVCLLRADVFPSVRVRNIRGRDEGGEGQGDGGEDEQGVTAGERRQRL